MPSTAGRRAIIVGAGVGGLTAAIALRRIGMQPVVFERASDLRKIQVGGGLQVWTNAMKAMRQLDLMDPLIAVSAELEQCNFRSQSGDIFVDWSVCETSRQLGAPSVGVSRVDLHRVLLGALGDGVVHVNSECTGYAQDKDGVTVRLADGREERGDLLIAADGGRSTLRSQVVGNPEPVQYAGYSIWQTVGRVGNELPPANLFGMWYGRGKRFIFYRVGGGQQHWAAIVNAVPGGGNLPNGPKAALLEWYQGWEKPIEAMIDATAESDISRVDMYGRPQPVRTWGNGRATLLGDAAHPVTLNLGQGACQAIEDAVTLAKHVQGAPDVVSGLRAYEAARQERTATVLTVAWNLGRIGQLKNPVLAWLRDRGLRLQRGRIERVTTEFSRYEV
jgi:2-polyprenyl-6-methoxyphenol hydroxylase-like FAD-dependent oxidoreductase